MQGGSRQLIIEQQEGSGQLMNEQQEGSSQIMNELKIVVVLFTFEISIFKSVSDERLCLKVLIEL